MSTDREKWWLDSAFQCPGPAQWQLLNLAACSLGYSCRGMFLNSMVPQAASHFTTFLTGAEGVASLVGQSCKNLGVISEGWVADPSSSSSSDYWRTKSHFKFKPQWYTSSYQSEWLLTKSQQTRAGEDVEKRGPLCTIGGTANRCGKQYGGSSKN